MRKLITLLAVVCFLIKANAQSPTYSISSASGSFTLGCSPSLITINMVNTSTVPIYNYDISPQLGVYNTSGSAFNFQSFSFFLPGTYVITSNSLPWCFCPVTQTFTIYPNALAPNVNVSPTTVSLTGCGGLVQLSASSTSTNVTGNWYHDYHNIYNVPAPNSEVPLCPPGTAITCSAGSIGLYAAVYKDNANGCLNVARASVTSTQTTELGMTASPNAYLPCANNSVTIGGYFVPVLFPTSFTVTNLTTSVSTNPIGAYTVTSPGYYMYEITDGNFCPIKEIFYIGSSTISPVVTVMGYKSVCKGTSTDLLAYGATSYVWNTGPTTNTINVLPNVTTNYTVTGMSGVCSGSAITTVSVDNTCSDVWPGDASSDGSANLFDVLEIGLQSGFTGPARSYTSNAWQAYFANNWTGTISNGKNRSHADCNGDGTVTASDANAIIANWGLTHTFKINEESVVNPDLSIVPDQPLVQIGTWGTASIYLGDATNNINLYGLAFNVNHNKALIETDSIYVEYINSFLNVGGTNIEFQKEIFSSSAVYAASTRTDHGDVNGNGKIGILHFKAVSTLSNNAVLNISLSNATKSNANSNFNGLTSGVGSVTITTSAIGINELNKFESNISLYPQPANGIVNIISNNFQDKKIEIKIMDVTGKIIQAENLDVNNSKAQLATSEFSNGVYILQITNSKSQTATKRLLISR